MQRCGIGGEGETGAFKCLTPSTLSPAPDAGPFFESRSGTPPGSPFVSRAPQLAGRRFLCDKNGYPLQRPHSAAAYTATPRRELHYREERLARFRRCCRFRSFHLAFWLLLSFARDAMVHLNAIGCSLAPVGERRDFHNAGCLAASWPTD